MPKNFDDDFELQPKFKNGVKQKGNGGVSKKNHMKINKSNSSKEIYNSKHIRIQSEKIENCRLKRPKAQTEISKKKVLSK